MPSDGPCRFCGNTRCYAHCMENEKGEHEPDPKSAHLADGASEFVVDFNCVHCGQGGAARVNPDEIEWD